MSRLVTSYLIGQAEDGIIDPLALARAALMSLDEHDVADMAQREEFLTLPHDEYREHLAQEVRDRGHLALANQIDRSSDSYIETYIDMPTDEAADQIIEDGRLDHEYDGDGKL